MLGSYFVQIRPAVTQGDEFEFIQACLQHSYI